MTAFNHFSVYPSTSDYSFRPIYSFEREQFSKEIEEDFSSDTSSIKFRENVLNDLYCLGSLEEGWDYGIGSRISNEVIQKAIDIHNQVIPYGLDCEVHPTTEGGINLIYASSDIFMDVNIGSNLSISLTKEQGVGFDYTTIFEKENVNEKELIQEISLMSIEKFLKCSLSEPYTSEDTVQLREDSQVIPSETTKAEFPFLIWNVPIKQQKRGFVSTFRYFIIPQ